MANILGIDPAQQCGYALTDGQQWVSGVWNLVIGKATLAEQHKRLVAYMQGLLHEYKVDRIAVENAGFGSRNPSVQAMHNERLGCIRYVAAERGIEVVTFQPSSIKLYATGDGSADKSQMIACCKRLLGLNPIDDNECDAIWIAHFASRPDCWPKKQPKRTAAKAFRSAKAAKKSGRLF